MNSNHLRRRGVTLTAQGSIKLTHAKVEAEIEHNFQRYTLETLSEKTGLTPTTLSKVFTGSSSVDKRTLESCFDAFNLILLPEDYLYLKPEPEQNNRDEIALIPLAETFDHREAAYDSCSNTLLTQKMTQQQDNNLQPRPPNVAAGQIPLDSVFYIDRPIVESLCYEAIQEPGALLNIRAPKQMGKSSLMSRILAYAKTLDYDTVSLSLQLTDAEILQNLELFLKWFCARFSKQLDLLNKTTDFWDNSLGSKANATDYFEDILLANLEHSLVIAIDELSQLFAYPDIASEFLELLRVWSEKAKEGNADSNPWYKLRLVTIYSTEIPMPDSLNPSLLNTGQVIKLPEFTSSQVQDLARRYEQEITEQQIEQLITLLGGHPYRLQLAFNSLYQQTKTWEELLENASYATAIYADHLEQQWWNLQRYPELLTVFTQIVSQSSPVDCEPGQGSQLQEMGLVHLQGLQASLACELFRPFFSERFMAK